MTKDKQTTEASKTELSEDELDSVQGGFDPDIYKFRATAEKGDEKLVGSKTLKS